MIKIAFSKNWSTLWKVNLDWMSIIEKNKLLFLVAQVRDAGGTIVGVAIKRETGRFQIQ